jgi:hypothetical protein
MDLLPERRPFSLSPAIPGADTRNAPGYRPLADTRAEIF